MNARLFRSVPIAALLIAVQGANAQLPGESPPTPGTRLDIAAESSVSRKPDLVTINAGVVTEASSAAAAMDANAQRMAAVAAALKRAGIAARDIQTAAISLSPQYRYEGQDSLITTRR